VTLYKGYAVWLQTEKVCDVKSKIGWDKTENKHHLILKFSGKNANWRMLKVGYGGQSEMAVSISYQLSSQLCQKE